MRWVRLGVLVAAVLCGLYGLRIEHTGRSADEQLGAVIPWLAGLVLLAIDAVLLLAMLVLGRRRQ